MTDGRLRRWFSLVVGAVLVAVGAGGGAGGGRGARPELRSRWDRADRHRWGFRPRAGCKEAGGRRPRTTGNSHRVEVGGGQRAGGTPASLRSARPKRRCPSRRRCPRQCSRPRSSLSCHTRRPGGGSECPSGVRGERIDLRPCRRYHATLLEDSDDSSRLRGGVDCGARVIHVESRPSGRLSTRRRPSSDATCTRC